MEKVLKKLGVRPGWRGLVSNEEYELMQGVLRKVRRRFLDEMTANTPEENRKEERKKWAKRFIPFSGSGG